MLRRSFHPHTADARHIHVIRHASSKSHTTIIIVAVVASVAALVLAFALWRLISSCRRRPVPLPPVQPLAHHREHQLAQFVEHKLSASESATRAEAWLTPASTSNVSLLPPTPARHLSLSTHETASSEHEPQPSLYGEPLQPPNPSFFVPDSRPISGSSSNLASEAEFSPNSPSPSIPSPNSTSFTRNNRRISTLSASTSRTSNTTRTTCSRSTHRSLPRAVAPHAPHSNVQIVLPTPLAPDLYPHMIGGEDSRGRPVAVGGEDTRSSWVSGSLVDGWTGVTAGLPRTTSRPESSSSYTRRRPRRGRSASSVLPSNDSRSRQSRSSSMSPSTSREGSFVMQGDPPPVPRIPLAYGAPTSLSPLATPPSANSPPSSYRGRSPPNLIE